MGSKQVDTFNKEKQLIEHFAFAKVNRGISSVSSEGSTFDRSKKGPEV
jgi:hypothetical protein